MIGPPQSGKTQLFNAIVGYPYSERYEINEHAQMGFKIYSTNESRYEHLPPLTVNCTDVPGSFMRTEIASQTYFENVDIIFIVVDISLVLDDSKIDKTSQFVLRQVSEHHPYVTDPKRIPPLICHVFSKQDRIQPAVRKRNDKVIKTLAKNGVIGNYLYVSAKTGLGMQELRVAIMDADIKDHGDKIQPSQFEKKKTPIQMSARAIEREQEYENDPDPFNPLMGLSNRAEGIQEKSRRKSTKQKNQDDNLGGQAQQAAPSRSVRFGGVTNF